MTSRLIPLDGGYNFRDLGGYTTADGRKTRAGRIFRSGGLHRLTEAGQKTLQDLKIGAAFDLRQAEEFAFEGQDKLPDTIELIHRPTSIGSEEMREAIQRDPRGFRMVDFYKKTFDPRAEYHAVLFKDLVVRMDRPLVFHCSAGKDRTGIFAALLLRLVGVSDEDIIADYALTREYLTEYVAQRKERFVGFGMPDFVADEILDAAPETIAELLRHLDAQYGNAEAYLMSGGATSEAIETFREQFQE